jgi:peptide/nickel transport system permease protein
MLAPYSVMHQDLDARFLGPSWEHWLGTDQHGIDTLSQVLHGTRIAAIISASVVSLCAITGTLLGVIAGYYRGVVDEVVMRVVDILLAFPGILLNIAIVALIARPGIGTMVIALCVNGWVRYARLARGQVLAMRDLEYVSAARAIGARPSTVMFRHILPNMLSPIVVMMSLSFGGVIAVEASLSFLGLGPQLDYSWGSLLDQGTTFSWVTPRLALIPGIAIMLVVLGSNLLGDGLRDYYDPKGRR